MEQRADAEHRSAMDRIVDAFAVVAVWFIVTVFVAGAGLVVAGNQPDVESSEQFGAFGIGVVVAAPILGLVAAVVVYRLIKHDRPR